MAVGLSPPQNLLIVQGIRLASCHSGIKGNAELDDLVLIEIEPGSTIDAVFTTNKFCAAPVTLAKKHLELQSHSRYLLINSGNANAGTGLKGIEDAQASCHQLSELTNVEVEAILPFSTGVIGQPLPVDKIQSSLPQLIESLAEDQWQQAAAGIMTTDTIPKARSRQININGQPITITGICKGSGMIKPDMATMLAYVATDAKVSQLELTSCLQQAVEGSFNSITVDGDTSTNDACVLVATGKSGVEVDSQHREFVEALNELFIELAQAIIRDGEGATKFVEIAVEQSQSKHDARTLAYTVAHSPLVKTALFASDSNWGRILAAVGRAPLSYFDIDKVDIYLGDVCLIEKGLPHVDYSESKGQAEMEKEDIHIRIILNSGEHSATIWTTDLSYDYVKINAEYRS
ncbi:MAG: bifunctional glutamate N-acetyltransferase/amino-acid acetyltransferase ArgJ [Gammaproteobacteria bacterium]|nr:bifunctional glutamate N-acetyltransferase/amino-acid acetyltransferase ArgJ [Gammaproteobacteria bacterium]